MMRHALQGLLLVVLLGGALYANSDDPVSSSALASVRAVQLSALIREEGATGGDLALSWLRFDDPDVARQNEPVAFSTRPLADFDEIAKSREAALPHFRRLHRKVWQRDVGMNRFIPRTR